MILEMSRKIKISMFLKHSNKSRDLLEKIKKENPFLKDQTNSHLYEFPLNELNFDVENVLGFIKKANND